MPVLDGEQTFRELRAISPTARVILSSGYTNSEVSRRFAAATSLGSSRNRSMWRSSSGFSPLCRTVHDGRLMMS